MDNKKLFKFLYKDIAEIEELVTEKGAAGLDEFEIEFIQSRFKGVKQIIQILSEKENKKIRSIRPRPLIKETEEEEVLSLEEDEVTPEQELEKNTVAEQVMEQSKFQLPDEEVIEEEVPVDEEQETESVNEEADADAEDKAVGEPQTEVPGNEPDAEVELEEETEETDEANHRLGDSFSKENSVNELLGSDSNNLEYKISNSPVESIKTAIGINDRYLYIRELFDGNADNFTKTITELDQLNDIQEAVAYLQQNYKWKKNETSLKFVNLIKRRFPNG